MNYAVYTYALVDGQEITQLIAYKTTDDPVEGKGFHLMTRQEAQAYADSIPETGITKKVLPLELDQAITAF